MTSGLRVATRLPDWDRRRTAAEAVEHRNMLAMERGDYDPAAVATADSAALLRWQVNMLRHNYTDYDIYGTTDAAAAVHSAIAAKYPWLAAEANRQTARMRSEDARAREYRGALGDGEWLEKSLGSFLTRESHRDWGVDYAYWTGEIAGWEIVATVQEETGPQVHLAVSISGLAERLSPSDDFDESDRVLEAWAEWRCLSDEARAITGPDADLIDDPHLSALLTCGAPGVVMVMPAPPDSEPQRRMLARQSTLRAVQVVTAAVEAFLAQTAAAPPNPIGPA